VLPLIDEYSPRRFPILTIALILLCVVVFGYQQTLPSNGTLGSSQAFECTYGMIPHEIVSGPNPALDLQNARTGGAPLTCQGLNQQHNRFLTLVTTIFIHASWWHLIGNMIFLWVFGGNLEDRLGRVRFLPFFVGGGVVAGLAQAFSQPSSTALVIGASGAIATVIGAYLVLFPRVGIWTLVLFVFPIKIPAWIWGVLFIALQLVDLSSPTGFGSNSVAAVAHLAGVAVGAATIRVVAHGRRAPDLVPRRFHLLASG